MPPGSAGSTHRLETLLAFGFGFVFCGVLAYAGLRSEPITDPGQFFLLRVLASISAAGVAAVIPGMLDIQIGQGKLFAIRGAGALGVFVLVFAVNPPELVRPASESKRAAMLGNYSQGLYEDANRIADDILKNDPNDAQSLNIKGGIAFYRGEYDAAVEFFRKAHLYDTKSQIYTSNYANALIETHAYTLALQTFKSIDDGKRDRSYSLGRAYFYTEDFDSARRYLEGVPSNYWFGAARIYHAATLLMLAQKQPEGTARLNLESEAKKRFTEGYMIDRQYWNGILTGTQKDKHQSYDKAIELLLPFYQEVIALK